MPGIQVTIKKTTTYSATKLVSAATGSTECFPSVATNVIRRDLDLDQELRQTIIPSDEQRDRIGKGAASPVQCARPQRRAFLAAWGPVERNWPNCLIAAVAASRILPTRS